MVLVLFNILAIFYDIGMDDDVRLALQDQLIDLIVRVLVNHEELHYYQVS